jgi:hypothetical protein
MAYERKGAAPDWLALWILFSAWSSLSGWCLSAIGCLDPMGIVLSYALFLALLILFRDHWRGKGGLRFGRVLRFRFLAPKLWLFLAVLAFVGGMAYSPNNYDYLSYRFPRVLNWSWEHGWYWIPTINTRINYSGVGFEWLMVPSFVLFKTDRFFFLINFIAYLLLPGLVFFVFTRLGISRRIAWWWMWVLPSGYCYVLQAASAGNDSFAAVYFLASLRFLFQAKASAPARNLLLSCLAIALMTGAKASNLPLVLPWLLAVIIHGGQILRNTKPATLAFILISSAAVSFLPMAILNIRFTGDYSGDPDNRTLIKISNPLVGVVCNSLQIAKDNLEPPILPGSVDWKFMLPSGLRPEFRHYFPRLSLQWGELQIEEGAGAGLGVVLFAGAFIVAGTGAAFRAPRLRVGFNHRALWITGSVAIALLVYMSKMGSESTSRLIAAYYPGLVAGAMVMVALDGRVVRRGVFRWLAYIAMLSAIPVLILCPARPLFPVQLVSEIISASPMPTGVAARFNDVYRVYALRSDAYRELLASIPPGERTIGLLQNGNASVAPLWRPFGSRKIIEVTPQDSVEELKAKGIHLVFVSQVALATTYHIDLAFLMTKWSASLLAEKEIFLFAHTGPEPWYLLQLK